VRQPGVYAVQVKGTDANAAGNYEIELSAAGDVNADDAVDGADSQALSTGLGKHSGQSGYSAAADVDGDGTVSATDRQVLIDNYGFVASTAAAANQPPDRPVFDLEPGSDTTPLGDQRTTLATVTLVGRTDPDTLVTLQQTGQTYQVGCTGLFYFS